MKVTLTGAEMVIASYVGTARHMAALKLGLKDAYGYDGENGLALHIAGVAGEMSVARALNVYWLPTVNTFKSGGDVGDDIQVRCRSSHTYDLLVRPDDPDDALFVLVTGEAPELVVRGAMRGREAKREEWKRDYGGRPPAYFVPQSALASVS